ncbi:MAG TPA: N-acetylornithine carbamoyltransferase, partial [Vicinamibacteria bacterium]|nr:N-acetylornithine carbamoyltransferase [Vicinamibacteria bacterium]
LETARWLEATRQPRALEGKVLALLFLSPSLRTQASFQAAMARLGGSSFVISPQHNIHKLETRRGVIMDGDAAEHVREAVPALCSYADAIGIRAFAPRRHLDDDVEDRDFRALVELCTVPYINMESAILHPTQSLADWKTLDELSIPRAGAKFVLSWAYHPKELPLAVPASTVAMAAQRGMDVTVLRPPGFALPERIMAKARALAASSGGSLSETTERAEALEGASVLYAKSWSSTTRYGEDEGELRRGLAAWRVEESWFGNARPDCRFMHCLPVRRGVVVHDEILDGPRSVVQLQARNRMWGQMAVLHRMLA